MGAHDEKRPIWSNHKGMIPLFDVTCGSKAFGEDKYTIGSFPANTCLVLIFHLPLYVVRIDTSVLESLL